MRDTTIPAYLPPTDHVWFTFVYIFLNDWDFLVISNILNISFVIIQLRYCVNENLIKNITFNIKNEVFTYMYNGQVLPPKFFTKRLKILQFTSSSHTSTHLGIHNHLHNKYIHLQYDLGLPTAYNTTISFFIPGSNIHISYQMKS